MVDKSYAAYSKHAVSSVLGNINRRGGDRYLSTVDAPELISYYYQMYSLPELVLLNGGIPRNIPEKASSAHSEAKTAKFVIRFDVEASPRIDRSLKLDGSNAPQAPKVDEQGFYFKENLSPESARERLAELSRIVIAEADRRNSEIRIANAAFKEAITRTIMEKKSRLERQGSVLKELSQVIPIELRTEPTSPIVPLVRKTQIAVNPPAPSGKFQSEISPSILNAIVDVLIRGGRTFETTPRTFSKLDEEDLRNLLLSFLNGNFEVRAVGEAFNKLGKSDISLSFSGNNLFVAECKFWGGEKMYQETVEQLFRYLTWRETIGVILCFVKEKDFTSIISKAKESTQSHESYVSGSLVQRDASYFLSTHVFPQDKDKMVRLHHLLFSITPSEG
jgi:hypothetical protein